MNFANLIAEGKEKSAKNTQTGYKKNTRAMNSGDLSRSSITNHNKRLSSLPSYSVNKSPVLFNNSNPGNLSLKDQPLVIKVADIESLLQKIFQPINLKSTTHLDYTYNYIRSKKPLLNNTQTSGFAMHPELVAYFTDNNLNINTFIDLFNNINNNFSDIDKTQVSYSVVLIKATEIRKINRDTMGPFEDIETTKAFMFVITDTLINVKKFLDDVFVFTEGIKNNEETNLVNIVVTRKLDTLVEELRSSNNYIFVCRASRVVPMKYQHGLLCIDKQGLCEFIPVTNNNKKKTLKFQLKEIKAIVRYRYLMQYKAINVILFSRKQSKVIDFEIEKEFEEVFRYLKENSPKIDKSFNDIKYHTNLWVDGLISNYDYLIYLNLVSSRSFVDLSQYPVMPWVITTYEDQESKKFLK